MNIADFSMDCFSLKGKAAIVTGGNSGLGSAFSVALAKAGADVFVASIMDDNGATKKMVEAAGRKYHAVHMDITQEGIPGKVVENCVTAYGSVDILVNCAGICLIADVLEFDKTKWDPMVAVNLSAAFEMSYEAAKVMVPRRQGKIINICSLFSFLGGQRSVAYAATKHGIAGLTKAYCDELAPHNIQVNGIAPGYFDTALAADSSKDEKRYNKIKDHIPAGHWGDIADLMGAVVFLASPAANYVNGHILTVDGGYLVR